MSRLNTALHVLTQAADGMCHRSSAASKQTKLLEVKQQTASHGRVNAVGFLTQSLEAEALTDLHKA